jgi:hypothetical protein
MAKKRAKAPKTKQATDEARPAGAGLGPRIPRWMPAAIFVALTLWLFRAFVFTDQMLLGGDTLSLGYVARAFYATVLKGGAFPLWNPQILGGTPFVEALSGGDSLYPPSALLLVLLEPYRALGWKLVLHVLAAGFFMFGWIRVLGGSRAAALIAGVAYMLAPFFVTLVHPGHDGKIFVTALAPLLFWMVERHFLRAGMASFAAMGFVVALVLLTTHFQMAYFLFGGVGLYAMFRTVQIWRGGVEPVGSEGGDAGRARALAPAGLRFALFLGASVAGAAGAGVQFLPAADYVTEYSRRVQTTREAAGETGRDWSSSWSIHPEEAMSQLIPEFAGNNARGSAWTADTYWGRNFFKDNHEGVGVLVLLLAAVSFVGAARAGVRWFFTGLGLVAFLFALGDHTPVWGIFYSVVPGIRLFRAPSQAMFLFGFSATTLAALGVDRVLNAAVEHHAETWRRLWRVFLGGTGLLTALALLAGSGGLVSMWTNALHTPADPGRLAVLEPFIVRGAFVSAALAAGAAGLAWASRRAYLAPAALVAGLLVLVSVDQLRVDDSFVQTIDFHEWSRPGTNLQAVLDLQASDPEPYRLFSLAQSAQDVKPALFGIELAAGHHPNDLSRYRELIGMVGSGIPDNLFHPNVRRLLNVRYILWPHLDPRFGAGPEDNIVSRTQLQDGRPYETVYADIGLPRARLLARAVVKSDAEAVPYMLSDAFDPAAEVVLSEESPVALDGMPVAGEVRWEERSPGLLRLSVTADRAALLVVADNWFPAWQATVDGSEAPVLRAYHTLRAIPVPAGEHTVTMEYRSAVLARSLWLSVVALLGLTGLGISGVVRDHRRRAS